MSLVVTGQTGFVGAYLVGQPGVVGLENSAGQAVDLLDPGALTTALARLNPHAVLHMAAQSAVPESFRDPVATYQANFIGTQNLFGSLKAVGFAGQVLYVSSAEVYGSVPEAHLPVTEETPTAPLNPYAVSKCAAELLCKFHKAVEQMDVVIARPFNHIGPGQSTRFALSDFAKSLIEIKRSLRPPTLHTGDLDVTRDFTDVRDVVRAYKLLLKHGQSGETYNICSGYERNMAETLQALAVIAGVDAEVKTDPTRLRKSGQRRSLGSSEKLRRETGWVPEIGWQKSLTDIVDYWDQKLA